MVTGDILAWQGAQVALRCSVVSLLSDDELDVGRGGLVGRQLAEQLDVPRRGAVAGLAIDPRLGPGGVVAVGLKVVVLGKLADVATEAGGVEGQRPFLPVERLVAAVAEMAHGAGRGVEPFLAADIVGHGQHLQPAALERRQEIKHVLAAHRLHHGIALLAFRPRARVTAPFRRSARKPILARHNLCLLRGKLGPAPTRPCKAAWPGRGRRWTTTGRTSRGIPGNCENRQNPGRRP